MLNSGQDKNMHKTHANRKNYMKLVLDWRHLSRKSLVGLAQQTGMCASSTQITIKLPHLHPYKTAMFHEQYNTDQEARLNFFNSA